MAKLVWSDLRAYFGGYELSTSATRLEVTLQQPALDASVMTDPAETVIAGMRADQVETAFLFDDDANAPDAAAGSLIASATNNVFSLFVGTATGSVAYVGTAILLSHKAPGELRGVQRLEITFGMQEKLGRGIHWGPRQAIASGTVSGTATEAASSTAGATFYLHVFRLQNSNSGTVILQHSTSSGGAYGDVVTVTGITGTASFIGTVGSGTVVQRFTRVKVDTTTAGGTLTWAAAVVRN